MNLNFTKHSFTMIVGAINSETLEDSLHKFFPEQIAYILRSDPEYDTVADKALMTKVKHNNKQIKGGYVPFVFGEKTTNALLDLNFECQRCGQCCYDSSSDSCEKLDQKQGENNCNVYKSYKYPLECYTYPFVLDQKSIKGVGLMLITEQAGEEARNIKFGLMGNAISLQVYSNDEHWTGNRALREMYRDVLFRLADMTENDTVHPPLVSSINGLKMSKKKIAKNGIDKYTEEFKQQLLNRKGEFLHETTKI